MTDGLTKKEEHLQYFQALSHLLCDFVLHKIDIIIFMKILQTFQERKCQKQRGLNKNFGQAWNWKNVEFELMKFVKNIVWTL